MAVPFKKSKEAEVKDSTLSKYEGVTGGQDIVSFVSDEHTWPITSHFIDGYGSFHCFKGQCCVDHKPSISYIYPIMKYKMTGNDLDYMVKPVEFKFLKASKDLFAKINRFEKTGVILPETDFLFECVDQKYQKIKIVEIKNKSGSKWRQDKEVVQKAKDFLKSYELLIESAVKIKSMDEDKYDNLESSPEYLQAMASFSQKQATGGFNKGGQQIQAPRQQVQQIQAPVKETIIDANDLDDMFEA